MPASPHDLRLRLHEDALFELGRAARALAHAISRAVDTGRALPADAAQELAGHVIDDCRAALLPVLVRAPGMLQLFVPPPE